MSERGMTECILKTGLEEAVKKDEARVDSLKSGVANGYYINLWLKGIAVALVEAKEILPKRLCKIKKDADDLPKSDNEQYEDGFMDGVKYALNEIKS